MSNKSLLNCTLAAIEDLDHQVMTEADIHQRLLAIPEDSLGQLHKVAVRLAGICRQKQPEINKTAVITMAGDHGVTAQGISRCPQQVTKEMVANFDQGGAAINVLSRHVGARLTVVDIGVAGALPETSKSEKGLTRLLRRKLADGTADISKGPAMSRNQAIKALETGIQVLAEEAALGLDAVGTGDMGIGNTTPSSAIASVLLDRDPAEVVNRGTGIDDRTLKHKIKIVAQALELNRPDPQDPLDILCKVGGYEIGGIAGVILGACARRIPVVVDGFISTAAALLASGFDARIKDYLFAGHQSFVRGHELMLAKLGLRPLVNLDMRLGEGTGAALGLSVLQASSRISGEMHTFEQSRVSQPQTEA